MATSLTTRVRALAALGFAAVGAAGCSEHFVTGPERGNATLALRGWSDTLVVGESRAAGVRVLDAQGREVVGASLLWQAAASAALDAKLNGRTALPAGTPVNAASGADSVQFTALRPGTADLLVTLADPRFDAVQLPVKATVVVAGVGLTSAHDTTVTAVGDTALLAGTAFARRGTGAMAAVAPRAGQGLSWTRRGTGAVTLVGTGDSVRVVAQAAGTDTLIVTHAACLAGARCADTTVVHVAQTAQALHLGATPFRAWAFGDSIAPQVVVQDARGNAIAGARLNLVPLTAADSAVVAVNTTVGVPAAAAPTFARGPVSSRVSGLRASKAAAAPLRTPLVIVADAGPRAGVTAAGALAALGTPAASLAPAAPLTAPPLVATQNGTARVAVQALGPGGTLLGADTVDVVVRQVANVVQVAPASADLSPGDSIPVRVRALDARGRLVADATFQPAMDGAVYRDGRIVIPANAPAGRVTLAAGVTGVAQPRNYVGAPIPDPVADTTRVLVRVPPPMAAGDTTATDANTLGTTIRGRDGQPLANTWVRFRVPAGQINGPDSVLTDARGVAQLRWTLPTQAGTYTATAVLLGAPASADSAGDIVFRRTATVVPGAPATLAFTTAPGATATLGSALAPAPVAQLRDAYGNAVPQAGVPVSVALAGAPNGFTLSGTGPLATDASGAVRFPGLVGSGAAGTRALTFGATVGGTALVPATATVAFAPGAPDRAQSVVAFSATAIDTGMTATITITPKDGTGARLGAGRAVAVTVPAPAAGVSGVSVSAVTDNGDGTYTATLTGVTPGTPVAVTAMADGQEIGGGPVTVNAPAPVGPPLALSLTATEKLPGGTQQFTIAAGPAGPYVWSVNGVDGGDAANGTVTAGGLYTAPSAVPTTNPVQVCVRVAASPAQRACSSVTINATPSAGADVVVFNDVNLLINGAGSGGGLPENQAFFANIVGFTGSAPRMAGRTVVFYNGASSRCAALCAAPSGNYVTGLTAKLAALGYTLQNESTSLTNIPADAKVVFVFTPTATLPRTEVNALKQFASEGGRVVIVGENAGYMGATGIAAENQLLADLGARLTNQGACLVPGAYAPAEGSHQLVTGVSQVFMNCVSPMTPGPNDFVLFRASAGGAVVGAVAKIDITPLP